MCLKKIGAALAAFIVLTAMVASSASAATPSTTAGHWVTTNGGAEQIFFSSGLTCSRVEGEESFVLRSKILGTNLKMTATGIACPSAVAKTTGSGESAMAILEGAFEFTGVTIDEPAGCKTSGTLKTNTLLGNVQVNSAEKKQVFLKVVPKEGETYATVKIEGCAAAGSYPLKGVLYTEMTNPSGVHAQIQTFAETETAVEMSSLKLGKEAATLTGHHRIQLAGGQSWGYFAT